MKPRFIVLFITSVVLLLCSEYFLLVYLQQKSGLFIIFTFSLMAIISIAMIIYSYKKMDES